MTDLLRNPMVQAGVAPLVVALMLAAGLLRSRHAWIAVVAAYATAAALVTGLSFSPLTAGRKVTLVVLLAPLVGVVLDRLALAHGRWLPWVLAALGGLIAPWVFASVLAQRDGGDRLLAGGGLVLFVGAHTLLALRLRDSGPGGAAHGIAAGLGVGVAALLSASVGTLTSGVALAAGTGALALLQFVLNRPIVPGYTGMLALGLAPALFAGATTMLAQLPWYALPLLAAVPGAARLAATAADTRAAAQRAQLLVAGAAAAAAAAPFVLVAWFAARAGSTVVG
jgi:hypothetical protein